MGLGVLGPSAQQAVPALIRALADSQPPVRRAAALALGWIDPASAATVPVLTQALKDPDPTVRRAVAQSLGRSGAAAKDAVPILVARLDDPWSEVGRTVEWTLVKIGLADEVPLVQALETAPPSTRPRVGVILHRVKGAQHPLPGIVGGCMFRDERDMTWNIWIRGLPWPCNAFDR